MLSLLAENQRTEIAEKLEHTEKRMKYEMRIGRAPKLNHHELEVRVPPTTSFPTWRWPLLLNR